jgi:F0F1-type ATP synthase assembly protein I
VVALTILALTVSGRSWRSVHPMRGIGAAYGLLVSTLLGATLGYGLDVKAEIAPLGLIAGCLLGFGAGLYNLYRALTQAS